MSQDPHVHALTEKHADLEAQISAELSRAKPDDIAVRMLKRRKLMIKDKLHKLVSRRYPTSAAFSLRTSAS